MRVSIVTSWATVPLILAIAVGRAQQQTPPQAPPPVSSTRPPRTTNRAAPLTPEEIAPNLNFYAMDPFYKAGTPLGWATERIRESLDRGLVAMVAEGGRVHLSWRLLDTDPRDVGFNLYRRSSSGEAKLTPRPIVTTTDFVDAAAPRDHGQAAWRVAAVVNGRELAASPGDVWAGAPLAGIQGDQAAGRRAQRRSRRDRRPQRRRRLRLRRQASRRARSIRGARFRARTRYKIDGYDGKRARSCGASISGGTSTTASGSRRWSCAISMATARPRCACGLRPMPQRASRRSTAARGFVLRGSRVPVGVCRRHGQGNREGRLDRARPARRTGPITPATDRAATCSAWRISTARRQACSSCAAPTA